MITCNNPQAVAWANSFAEGIFIEGGEVKSFPGGLPTQAQVDAWEMEYMNKNNKDGKKNNTLLCFKNLLKTGIKWRETAQDDWFNIKIDDGMASFLGRIYQQLDAGIVNPHKGKLFSGGMSVNIDDAGIKELCEFAAEWSNHVSFIHQEIKEGFHDGSIDPSTFDPLNIDWSITWPANKVLEGWVDNTLTQTI